MSSVSELFLTVVIEKRLNIEVCVTLDKTSTETYELLHTVYGDEA
jgi:hypothetical protein